MRSKRVLRFQIDVEVVEGSFESVQDIVDYMSYRLNLRGRNSDSSSLAKILFCSDELAGGQLEMEALR